MDVQTLALKAARNENLPVLPVVATRVVALTSSSNTPSHMLEKLIVQDVALSAKILRVSNSSLYGGHNIATIGRAITMLGFNAVRSIAVTLAMQQATSHRPSAPNFKMAEFWSHSLATAVAAKALARHAFSELQDELYLAGLLHDFGILVVDRFEPDALTTVLGEAKTQEAPVCAIMRAKLGFDHFELGGILGEKWEFSPFLVDLIRWHYDPPCAQEKHRTAAGILKVANCVAEQAGLFNQSKCGYALEEQSLEELGLNEAAIQEATALLVYELVAAQKALSAQVAA